MPAATPEMHRDRETTCREEVRGESQRRGARAAQCADPKGQRPRSPGTESTHPAEGRCLGDRRSLERQPDRRSAGYQRRHHRPHPPAPGGGGIDAALTRKHSPNSARKRIFDGAAEAKLIALACSPPPKGRARWTLTLLETAVVELHIVDRASDNTIGRTLKKTLSSRTCRSNGLFRPRPTPPS